MAASWQLRELARFEVENIYLHVPWKKEFWADHYPIGGLYKFGSRVRQDGTYPHYRLTHVCLENPALVAFTSDSSKGQRDLTTSLRVGRYLRKFYKHLSDNEIKDWVTLYNESFGESMQIKFAVTPEEIAYVYNEGPESCMKKSDFSSKIHPCSVYGAGDLAVAYMERKNKITSRAVCWPDKKIHSTIYGDSGRMLPILKQLKYVRGDMSGAKLLQVRHTTSHKNSIVYVTPYLDGNTTKVSVGEKFNYIGDIGDKATLFSAGNTNGLGDMMVHCETCALNLRSSQRYSLDEYYYCKSHFSEVGYTCTCCENTKSIRVNHVKKGEGIICYECYLRYHFKCSICDTVKGSSGLAGSTENNAKVCNRCLSIKKINLMQCHGCGTINDRDSICKCGYDNTLSKDLFIDRGSLRYTIALSDTTWTTFISTGTL